MVSRAQLELKAFLGKRNFKGLYTRNPLARTPDYHKFDPRKAYLTSYPIRPQYQIDRSSVKWREVFSDKNSVESRRPFAENKFTKSNLLVGPTLRDAIVRRHADGASVQQISFSFGIAVPRVNAIIKLEESRKKMADALKGPQKLIAKDMAKMARAMTRMFEHIPVNERGEPKTKVDDLSEIPVQKETRQQLFTSIAESEPFGPVDAAKALHLEPAKQILEKLSTVGEGEQQSEETSQHPRSFYADRLEGERFLFRFTDASVGRVGFHYGAARDDTKPGRKVVYQPDGTRVYPPPEHS